MLPTCLSLGTCAEETKRNERTISSLSQCTPYEETHRHSPSPPTILPSLLPAGGEWASKCWKAPGLGSCSGRAGRAWVLSIETSTHSNPSYPWTYLPPGISGEKKKKKVIHWSEQRGGSRGSPLAHWGIGNFSVGHFISSRALFLLLIFPPSWMSWFISTSKGAFPELPGNFV